MKQATQVGHTLGPWTWMHTPSAHTLDHPSSTPDVPWDGSGEDNVFDELRGANGRAILVGVPCNDSTAEISINEVVDAYLIAAAPDLLNAARLAEMMLGVEAQMHRENQAPKKAEAVDGAIATIRAAIAKAEGREK